MTLGLTLQSAKTKILPVKRFMQEVLVKPEESISVRDHAISLLKEFKATEYDDDEELDENAIQETLELLQGVDLHGMLLESISDTSLVDYEIVNYVLTRLPRMPESIDPLKKDVLDLVIDNAELLYPSSEQVAKYIASFTDLPKSEKKKIAKKLLKPLKSSKNSPPTYYAMWVLYIFTTSEDWNQINEIIHLYQNTTSEVIKRYAALAIAIGGSRSEALIIKNEYAASSDVLRLAILLASSKLGSDERKHWKLSVQVKGTIEKII